MKSRKFGIALIAIIVFTLVLSGCSKTSEVPHKLSAKGAANPNPTQPSTITCGSEGRRSGCPDNEHG